MSHNKRLRYTRQRTGPLSGILTLVSKGPLVAIAAVVVFFVAMSLMASRIDSVGAASDPADGSKPVFTCGGEGQPSCPPADPHWITASPETAAEAAAVITANPANPALSLRYGCTGKDLDSPVLVHAYQAHTGYDYYDNDHWVASARTASGTRCGIFDLVYDRAHQRVRYGGFGVTPAEDPRSQMAFPYLAASSATDHLRGDRGIAVAVGKQPELIFFPPDPSIYDPRVPAAQQWMSGGNDPMNPMWRLVGADGRDYFVGRDVVVHVNSELPFAPGQSK